MKVFDLHCDTLSELRRAEMRGDGQTFAHNLSLIHISKAYTDRIQDLNCEVAGNGVRHLSADVRGGGRSLYQRCV